MPVHVPENVISDKGEGCCIVDWHIGLPEVDYSDRNLLFSVALTIMQIEREIGREKERKRGRERDRDGDGEIGRKREGKREAKRDF